MHTIYVWHTYYVSRKCLVRERQLRHPHRSTLHQVRESFHFLSAKSQPCILQLIFISHSPDWCACIVASCTSGCFQVEAKCRRMERVHRFFELHPQFRPHSGREWTSSR